MASNIDPRAREIAERVNKIDRLYEEQQREIARVSASYDEQIMREETALAALLPPSRTEQIQHLREQHVEKVRRRKAKKRWKQAALFIAAHPTAGYPELSMHMYARKDEPKLKTLRGMLFHMREAGAVEGDPGAWKLLKTPDEIEWLDAPDDDEEQTEAA